MNHFFNLPEINPSARILTQEIEGKSRHICVLELKVGEQPPQAVFYGKPRLTKEEACAELENFESALELTAMALRHEVSGIPEQNSSISLVQKGA